jgi:large subunit ribosomal protein L32
MPLPKRRHSPARQAKRRNHDQLAETAFTECPHCHATLKPHNACPKCGFYKGRKVDHTIKDKEKKS